MRTQLHIGEVAQLLGVTAKTIRHYHKVGLLAEPERTESGYRLYTADHLLQLQRVRRLQAFGLSLKQIKVILGEPGQEHTLRDVLQSLLEELAMQIQTLEERRQNIQALLDKDVLEQQPDLPPSLAFAREQLGGYLANASPALWEQEARMFAQIDGFHWPEGYRERITQMTRYFAAHPELYQRLLAFGERFAALAALSEDALEVEQLIAESMQSGGVLPAYLQEMSALLAQTPQLERPFACAMSDLIETTLAPAQRRFFAEIARRAPRGSSAGDGADGN
jgi:DNA-binding transcriptional MerR regulator